MSSSYLAYQYFYTRAFHAASLAARCAHLSYLRDGDKGTSDWPAAKSSAAVPSFGVEVRSQLGFLMGFIRAADTLGAPRRSHVLSDPG